MNINYLFVIISPILGYFLINYLRSFDLHEKEPIFKMLVVALWGGIWSVGISLFLYGLIHKLGISRYDNISGAVFIIGPVEELAKFVALLSSYFLIRKELNEPTDGLIYMACVALGFSLIENYFYAVRTPNSGYLLFFRLLISTPLHIFSSVFMGLAFYVLVKFKQGMQLLFISFGYAISIHGLFDGIIFHSWLMIFLMLVLKLSYNWALSLLSYTTAKSPFRAKLRQFIDSNGSAVDEIGMECINCGNIEKKETYKLGKIKIQKCNGCNSYVTSADSLYYIFHYFGSDFRDLTNRYKNKDIYETPYSTLFQGNYLSDTKRMAFFKIDELEKALEEYNEKLIQEIESQWWFTKGLTIA